MEIPKLHLSTHSTDGKLRILEISIIILHVRFVNDWLWIFKKNHIGWCFTNILPDKIDDYHRNIEELPQKKVNQQKHVHFNETIEEIILDEVQNCGHYYRESIAEMRKNKNFLWNQAWMILSLTLWSVLRQSTRSYFVMNPKLRGWAALRRRISRTRRRRTSKAQGRQKSKAQGRQTSAFKAHGRHGC